MKNKNIDILRVYKKEYNYSYTLGSFATIEMIYARPEVVRVVYIHSSCSDKETIKNICKKNNITIIFDDEVFKRINQKENYYVIGVFDKYLEKLNKNKPHIVLVNPGDMGNLGTIIRIAACFNICNLGIVMPAADILNPKTIRASMGSLFRINYQLFQTFEEYLNTFKHHRIFPFMLNASTTLSLENCPKVNLFSLVFGNEATGLNAKYNMLGTSIKIPQSELADSLNISVAAGIGAYTFATKNGLV